MMSMQPQFASLSDQIEGMRQEYGIPGMNVAVTLGRDIVFAEAFGVADLETQAPLALDAVLPIGSVTKPFIATLLMQLVEQGIVHLADPLVRYLPEYPHPGTTLLQLACHTSGLPRDAAVNYPMSYSIGKFSDSDGQVPLEWYASPTAVLASLPAVQFETSPDSGKSYSNLGTCLLGVALERATGQSMARLLAERVFTLAEMSSTEMVFAHRELSPALAQRLPPGYVFTANRVLRAPAWELGCAGYSGGIVSTLTDMANFLAAHLDPLPTDKFLTHASILRMRPAQSSGDAYIGWWKGWYGGHENFGHAGAHVGYMATVLGIPALHLGVVVLTNRFNPARLEEHSTEIARKLLEILAPQVPACQPPVFDPDLLNLGEYAGTYALAGGLTPLRVDVKEGKLLLTWLDRPYAPEAYLPIGPDLFTPQSSPVPIPILSFVRGEDSAIIQLNHAFFTFYRS